MPEIILIAAVAANGVIGKGNSIPWHISADFRHFKELTQGSPVIMGSRTWESLPKKPLPGRKNIVLSRRKDLVLEGAIVVGSLEDALKVCQKVEKIFVIGGASLYAESMAIATKLEITRLGRAYEGETLFPPVDAKVWRLEKSEKQSEDPEYGPFAYETWVRGGF